MNQRHRLIIGGILLSLSLAGPLWASTTSGSGTDALEGLSISFEQITSRVAPAVVQIFTTGYGIGGSGSTILSRETGTASGIIIDPEGYIATNAHVVAGMRRIQVQVATGGEGTSPPPGGLKPLGGKIEAKVVGVDLTTDLALLKIPTSALPALPFGDSDQLKQGQVVLAVGSPLGLGNTVTMGIVSAVSRQLNPDDPTAYVQTDAPINPGNSGGPLVDMKGQVIGINTLILSQSGGNEGVGLAIPSNTVRDIMDQLRRSGHVHRGVIGVQLQTVNPVLVSALQLPVGWGVIISDVAPDGPADKAGLEIGDIILSVDGKPVDSVRQFGNNLYRHATDATVALEVMRGSEKRTFTVPVMEKPDDPYRFMDLVDPQKNLVPRLGILGVDITADLAAALPAPRIAGGVLVAAISPDADPSGAAFKPGDVIHSMNRTPIGSLAELRSVVDRLKPGAAAAIQVERQGMLLFITQEIE